MRQSVADNEGRYARTAKRMYTQRKTLAQITSDRLSTFGSVNDQLAYCYYYWPVICR